MDTSPEQLGGIIAARPHDAEVWQAHGLWCAVIPSPYAGLNGYVRIPEGVLIDVETLESPALTYGPDRDGWVGFDTAHYWDVWADPDMASSDLTRQLLAHGIKLPLPEEAVAVVWTREKMRDTVEHLAAQVAEVAERQAQG